MISWGPGGRPLALEGMLGLLDPQSDWAEDWGPHLHRQRLHPLHGNRRGPSTLGGGTGPAAPRRPGRPAHSATRDLHPPQRRHLRGRPVPPRSPAPGRRLRRPAGPIRHRTPSPSAHCATLPAGPRTRGGHRPAATALGERRKGCDILEALEQRVALQSATRPVSCCWWVPQSLGVQESSGERPWSLQEAGG